MHTKKNNKRDLRIVFMGTPEFAVTILKGILKNGYTIVGVITAPDKPSGRGRKINQSAVKKFALEQNLTILQPKNLKNETFQQKLKDLQANVQVVVAFRMLPKAVWKMPKYGTFNLHASLLPEYRGAAPINWAIINGETKTGVTTFFIDEKIDTGEIILQKEVPISSNENAGQLHDKLMYIGSTLVNQTLEQIQNNTIKTIPQPKREYKNAPKIYTETCKINWNEPLKNIYNKIRGLSPYPVAWTSLQNGDTILNMKIYQAEAIFEKHKLKTGTILISKKELKIAVIDGFLSIKELKVPGKRKMDVLSFLNGFHFENSIYVV